MLIERKLKDGPHGTRITLWGTRYFFEPVEPGGAHVAEVADKAHIERFLSIPEGFGVWTGSEDDAAPVEPAPTPQPAPEPTPPQEPTGEGAGDGDTQGSNDDAMPLEYMTEDDLKKLYQEELGRAPHWNARMETLIEHIKEHREGAADQE